MITFGIREIRNRFSEYCAGPSLTDLVARYRSIFARRAGQNLNFIEDAAARVNAGIAKHTWRERRPSYGRGARYSSCDERWVWL